MNDSLSGFICLALVSVVYVNAASGLERLRLVVANRQVSTMLGVFTFAGVVALPYEYVLVLVAVVYAAAWPTFMRSGVKPGKQAYSTATVIAACWFASVILTHAPGRTALPLAIAAFMLVNACLLALGMVAVQDWASLPYLRNGTVWKLVLQTQLLGAALGLAVQWHPAGSVVTLPVIGYVHREALAAALRDARAYVDDVWSRDAWLVLAYEAERRREWFSILVIDVTQMRSAHPVVRSCVEARARIGRYSDTQMAVLLPERTAIGASIIARQISTALQRAGIEAAVGSVDSNACAVSSMLAIACGDAIIQRAGLSVTTESDVR